MPPWGGPRAWGVGGDPADLSAYVDGELRPLRRARLRRHLERCTACRRYVEQLELVRAALAAGPGAEAAAPELRAALDAAFARWQVEHGSA